MHDSTYSVSACIIQTLQGDQPLTLVSLCILSLLIIWGREIGKKRKLKEEMANQVFPYLRN